jgi:hypothetical protein
LKQALVMPDLQLPRDGARAPSLDVVLAQDLRLELG